MVVDVRLSLLSTAVLPSINPAKASPLSQSNAGEGLQLPFHSALEAGLWRELCIKNVRLASLWCSAGASLFIWHSGAEEGQGAAAEEEAFQAELEEGVDTSWQLWQQFCREATTTTSRTSYETNIQSATGSVRGSVEELSTEDKPRHRDAAGDVQRSPQIINERGIDDDDDIPSSSSHGYAELQRLVQLTLAAEAAMTDAKQAGASKEGNASKQATDLLLHLHQAWQRSDEAVQLIEEFLAKDTEVVAKVQQLVEEHQQHHSPSPSPSPPPSPPVPVQRTTSPTASMERAGNSGQGGRTSLSTFPSQAMALHGTTAAAVPPPHPTEGSASSSASSSSFWQHQLPLLKTFAQQSSAAALTLALPPKHGVPPFVRRCCGVWVATDSNAFAIDVASHYLCQPLFSELVAELQKGRTCVYELDVCFPHSPSQRAFQWTPLPPFDPFKRLCVVRDIPSGSLVMVRLRCWSTWEMTPRFPPAGPAMHPLTKEYTMLHFWTLPPPPRALRLTSATLLPVAATAAAAAHRGPIVTLHFSWTSDAGGPTGATAGVDGGPTYLVYCREATDDAADYGGFEWSPWRLVVEARYPQCALQWPVLPSRPRTRLAVQVVPVVPDGGRGPASDIRCIAFYVSEKHRLVIEQMDASGAAPRQGGYTPGPGRSSAPPRASHSDRWASARVFSLSSPHDTASKPEEPPTRRGNLPVSLPSSTEGEVVDLRECVGDVPSL